MDYAEGDRRINEEKEVVVEKEWQQFRKSNSSNSSRKRTTVDTMSAFEFIFIWNLTKFYWIDSGPSKENIFL